MGGIPLAALAINQNQPGPLEQVGKALQLKSLMQNQQYQAQAQPLELQRSGQALQSEKMANQLEQMKLDNAKTVQSALTSPTLGKEFEDYKSSQGTAGTTAAQPSGGGVAQLHPFAQFLMEKKGLPLMGPGGAMELSGQLTGNAQKIAELQKTQGEAAGLPLKNHAEQLGNFNDLAAPILEEKDPARQSAAMSNMQSQIAAHPELYPQEVVQNIGKIQDPKDLATVTNTAKLHQMVIEDASKQAEASQKTLAAGAPTPQQIQNASGTLASYRAIPPDMKAGFATELKNAPNFSTMQDIQKRVDAANESFQRSADARAQANSMKDVAIGQVIAGKLTAEDQKLGDTLKQTNGIRSVLDMSKGGNQTATAAAQVRFAEHEIVEGGVKRMNQLELESLATSLGSYGRKFQAWVDKGFDGKMPDATNGEMNAILNAEEKAAQSDHERSVGYITNRYGAIGGGAARQVQRQTAAPTAAPGGMAPAATAHPFFSQFGGQAKAQTPP